MNSENYSGVIVAAILGFCLIFSAFLIKGSDKNVKYVLKQEGPVFIRFSQASGELCYTGIGPNGKFITDSWLCLSGNKVKEGEAIEIPSVGESANKEKSNKKTSENKEQKKK
ncbi:MAG: hypothetical protein QNJ31_01475 [Candidatus Caenarcaniphilales bacterium]|nr:hypothetical protein [Candidatus Caenarcaniphilales bacterium]